jgi:uncharacterized iron-regulated protein
MMRTLLVLAVLTATAACSSIPKTRAVPDMPLSEARNLLILDGSTGEPVPWSNLVQSAAATDVLLIGENHYHPVGLPWAAALWEDVSAIAPSAALSLEFFERDDQSRLDDYLRGVTDEAAFEKRTERTSGNYPHAHKLMVERAKDLGLPVIAANTPREFIRYLRGRDYTALEYLTPEQQRLFKIPQAPPEGRYRADFDKFLEGGHGMSGGQPAKPTSEEEKQAARDRSFRPQYLWDWTMGDSIARAVEAGRHPVVHIIGRFHSDFFGGTPQAVSKLRPGTRILIISTIAETSSVLRDEDKGRADYVVYIGPDPKP